MPNNLILKDYQSQALSELIKYLTSFIDEKNRKEIIFKAPTGSGKTFIISNLISRLSEELEDKNFCFLWVCPGKGELHKQSYEAVKKYLGGSPNCLLLEDESIPSLKFIKNKEVVFINWEKLVEKDGKTDKWTNNLMCDQESMNFIDYLAQTKKNNTKIILIIDEQHIGKSQTARIQEFKNNVILPSITLEMSATPLSDHIDVEVNINDVIAEGMIKESLIVNEGINKNIEAINELDSEILILEKGFEKRNEIVKNYQSLNINVNPLVLIQIPNKDAGDAKKLTIIDFLAKKGITEKSGKLKFWCDNQSNFNKKAIKNLDDITEYLVFKTAVATGWDCPRAHILIKFRETKSETFATQTVGRILRTAEAQSYNNYCLDNAYMFTNLQSFHTDNDTYNPNKIKSGLAKLRDGYTKDIVYRQTQLKSYYRSRQGDYNSADSRFSEFLRTTFEKQLGIDTNNELSLDQFKAIAAQKGFYLDLDTKDFLIKETVVDIKTVDEDFVAKNDTVSLTMSDSDVEITYYNIIKECLSGLTYVRSKSPIHTAIVSLFTTYYDVFPRNQKIKNIMRIVVKNKSFFTTVLLKATTDFKELLKDNNRNIEIYDFNFEQERAYSTETHIPIEFNKSLYSPLYVLKKKGIKDLSKDDKANVDNKLELKFLKYLDFNIDTVEWFWQNGTEVMKTNFGILYNDGRSTFQPDFIVKFKDGTVGIFDTKATEYRFEDTKVKAEALAKYIQLQNNALSTAPKLIGGIVVEYADCFYVHSGKNYETIQKNINNWKSFDALLNQILQNIKNK